MKLSLKNLSKISVIVLLLCIGYSCSKNKSDSPDPSVITKPSLTAKIDSTGYTLDAAAITSTYYTTDGDDVHALLATGRLNTTGSKIVFFINDFQEGTINLSKKTGTSLNPGNPRLKVNATAASPAVQTYVKYIKDGNTYYASSGTISVIIKNNATTTVKWDIKFTDATSRSFASSGSFDLTNYLANPKPKSAIVDPTPVTEKPTIEGILPTMGFAGDTVIITGVNYSTVLTDNVVQFNGVAAKVVSATATKILAIAPANGTSGLLSLKVKSSETISGPAFTYLQTPTITSISPISGKAGDTVVITGTNFSTIASENSVAFEGNTGSILISSSATKLYVKVPSSAATGKIRLTVSHLKSIIVYSQQIFTLTNLPSISFASPYNGRAGDVVNVYGSFFSPNLTGNIVTFNGVPAKVVYASTTQLTVQVPQGASTGKILVAVNGKTSVDGYAFTVDAPYPNIQWQEIYTNNGVQNTNLMASLRNGLLFTGGLNPNYLYFSADDQTFTNVYNNLPFNKNKSLAIHLLSSDGTAFYVTSNLGVARSTDGQTWTKLVPNPGNPDMGFTGIVTTEGRIYLVSGSTLYKSANSGQTWVTTAATVPVPLDYFTSFTNNKYIFAADTSANTASYDATKFYTSISQGTSWSQLYGQGVTGVYHFDAGYKDFLKTSSVNTFCAFSPVSSPGLSSQRLYISKNQGADWTKLSDELCYVVKTNNSYVGYGSSTFNLSTNDGVTFKSFALPAGYTLGGIEFGSFIYISAYNAAGSHKIFRSSY
jgi:hypothetical protein